MANEKNDKPNVDTAEQAINRVLEAEHASEQAMLNCESQANEIVEAAQQRAQRITARTDERITRIYSRSKQYISGQIKALEHADRNNNDEYTSFLCDEQNLKKIIEDLADLLTGATAQSDSGEQAE